MKFFITLIATSFFYLLATASVIIKRENSGGLNCIQMAKNIKGFVTHYEKGLRQFTVKKATKDKAYNEKKVVENASKAANTLTSIMHKYQTTCQSTRQTSSIKEESILYKDIRDSCKSLALYNLEMNNRLPTLKRQNAELNSATNAVTNRCLNPYTPRFFHK